MSEVWYVLTRTQLDAFASAAADAARKAVEAQIQGLLATAGQFSPPVGVQSAAPTEPRRVPEPHAAVRAQVPLVFESGPAKLETPPLPPGKKYRVAKGGSTPYGDIVLNELPPEDLAAFDASAVWAERLEPIVDTESGRARETFRRSLANDKRFRRLTDRDGWWFAKVEASANGSAAGAPTPTADSGES